MSLQTVSQSAPAVQMKASSRAVQRKAASDGGGPMPSAVQAKMSDNAVQTSMGGAFPSAIQASTSVQMKASARSPGAVQRAAAQGTSGPSQAVPHGAQIQASFGPKYPIQQAKAHVGGPAAVQANEAIGSEAYASGSAMVFKKADPSVQLVAHESAHHVQQQQGGVQLSGGVGQAGDKYEQNADAVAQKVVQGKSAEPLLDSITGGGGGGGVQASAVQMDGTCDPESIVHLPGAVEPNGELAYYGNRNNDFINRYASEEDCTFTPPVYYMGYGHKYIKRFKEEVRPRLTAEGQAWLDQAAINLQTAIEAPRIQDAAAFDLLEKDDGAFTAFAYATHADAYWAAGLGDLNIFDLAHIGMTPDFKDLVAKEGLLQVVDIGSRLLGKWGSDAVDYVAGKGTSDMLIAKAYEGMQIVGDRIDDVFGEGTTDMLRTGAQVLGDIAGDVADTAYDKVAEKVGVGIDLIDGALGEGTVARGADRVRRSAQDGIDWAENTWNSIWN